jgi:hypothetical protein
MTLGHAELDIGKRAALEAIDAVDAEPAHA